MYEIEINGKKYKVKSSVKFGVLRRLQKNADNMDNQLEFVQSALTPKPSEAEVDEFEQEEVEKVMEIYALLQKEKQIDMKKKLS